MGSSDLRHSVGRVERAVDADAVVVGPEGAVGTLTVAGLGGVGLEADEGLVGLSGGRGGGGDGWIGALGAGLAGVAVVGDLVAVAVAIGVHGVLAGLGTADTPGGEGVVVAEVLGGGTALAAPGVLSVHRGLGGGPEAADGTDGRLLGRLGAAEALADVWVGGIVVEGVAELAGGAGVVEGGVEGGALVLLSTDGGGGGAEVVLVSIHGEDVDGAVLGLSAHESSGLSVWALDGSGWGASLDCDAVDGEVLVGEAGAAGTLEAGAEGEGGHAVGVDGAGLAELLGASNAERWRGGGADVAERGGALAGSGLRAGGGGLAVAVGNAAVGRLTPDLARLAELGETGAGAVAVGDDAVALATETLLKVHVGGVGAAYEVSVALGASGTAVTKVAAQVVGALAVPGVVVGGVAVALGVGAGAVGR